MTGASGVKGVDGERGAKGKRFNSPAPAMKGRTTTKIKNYEIARLLAGILILAAAAWGRGRDLPPAADFAPGWSLGETIVFVKGNLYDFIDGGADLYLEFGFERVLVQRYRKGEAELTLEAYEMTDADAALGIYLMKCGVETPVQDIPARNTGEPAQLTILKGRYFLHVNSFSPGADLLSDMVRLARRALESIADERPGPWLDLLPAEGLVLGSERLIRGPNALQSIYTLGEGDILLLGGRLIAVAGDYRSESGPWTLIVVPYPDETGAAAALSHLRAHLDSYLTVTDELKDGFVFKDFKEKYGAVERKGRVLEIRLNLSSAFGLHPQVVFTDPRRRGSSSSSDQTLQAFSCSLTWRAGSYSGSASCQIDSARFR